MQLLQKAAKRVALDYYLDSAIISVINADLGEVLIWNFFTASKNFDLHGAG